MMLCKTAALTLLLASVNALDNGVARLPGQFRLWSF
jgi:hypothetical protein